VRRRLAAGMDKKNNIAPAYVLGGGLLALGLVRSLGRHGVPVTIVKEGAADISFHSRHVRGIALGDHTGARDKVDCLIAAARRESQKPVLFVAGDMNLLAACQHEAELREHFHCVLPTLTAAQTVVGKSLFQDFAARHAVPVPQGWNPRDLDELRALADSLPYPLVLKPVRSADWHLPSVVAAQGHRKMILVEDRDRLLAEWSRVIALAPPPLVQEYVRGGDDAHYSYVSYRDRDGTELAWFCVHKLRLNPIHGGFATLARVVSEPTLEATGRRVLDQLDYRGAASVCFKRDPLSQDARIFEINGRIPLAHGASELAGIDLPWLMYRDALGLEPAPSDSSHSSGHWLALTYDLWAARDYRKAGELSVMAWLRSLLRVRVVVELDPRDPGPFLHLLGNLLRTGGDALWRRFRGLAAAMGLK
jgi:predicted ATP-grasp superfamily ATP-dependent carboligase